MSTYRRILLKLSGEILSSDDQNISPKMLNKVVNIVHSALNMGVEVAIVIGGGNIFRGVNLANAGMNRVTGDHIGMLATVMNALAISDAFVRHNIPCQVMSGLPIGGGVCDSVDHNKAKNALSQGKVVIILILIRVYLLDLFVILDYLHYFQLLSLIKQIFIIS